MCSDIAIIRLSIVCAHVCKFCGADVCQLFFRWYHTCHTRGDILRFGGRA
jgi:hypothetical protein